MQITSCETKNSKYVQIYLTVEEFDKRETEDIIYKYKKEKCNVAVFVTGKEYYPEILEKIVTKQVELNKDESYYTRQSNIRRERNFER